jgi:anti-anti-sigma factor
MTAERQNRHERSARGKNAQLPDSPAKELEVIEVEREGDWMPVEELRAAALAVLAENRDLTLDLKHVDHLDASALQILLAFDTEQKARARQLRLKNVSEHLRQWFVFAGVAERFLLNEPQSAVA